MVPVTARITAAQARALGIDAPKAKQRTTRKEATGPYRTRCTTCGEEFTSMAAEDRHVTDTLHARYAICLFERKK